VSNCGTRPRSWRLPQVVHPVRHPGTRPRLDHNCLQVGATPVQGVAPFMEDGGHGRAHTDAIDLILALTSTARISSAAHRRFALVGGDPPDSLRRPPGDQPGNRVRCRCRRRADLSPIDLRGAQVHTDVEDDSLSG
jgi:hypothetical protein